MPPLRRRGPTTKRKGPSKEELERQALEAELKIKRDELHVKEVEAAKFQRQHDLERDEDDGKAGFRIRRENEKRELFEKSELIDKMNLKMAHLQEQLETEKTDTDREVSSLRTKLEKSTNIFDENKKETDEHLHQVIDDRERLIAQNVDLEVSLSKSRAHVDSLLKDNARLEATSAAEVLHLTQELAELRERTHRQVSELQFRLGHSQREVEKATKLNETMKEMLAAREQDDKKNLTLLELLNKQLDEAKKRSQEFLEDERRRNREATNELQLAQAKIKNSEEENILLKQTVEATKNDSGITIKQIRSNDEEIRGLLEKAREETEVIKKRIQAELDESLKRGVTLGNDIVDINILRTSSQQQVEDLECLLKKTNKDMNDRVAFLNAQIAADRGIIRELLDKIKKQQQEHEQYVIESNEKLDVKQAELAEMSKTLLKEMETARQERDKEMRIRQANDAHFRGRIDDLETEIKKSELSNSASASASLVAAGGGRPQSEYEVAIEEIQRLEELLERHCIIHRPSHLVSLASGKTEKVAADLASKEKIPSPPPKLQQQQKSMKSSTTTNVSQAETEKLQRENQTLRHQLERSIGDNETQKRIALEVETRLNAQVKNQYEIVDALNAELSETKKDLYEKIFHLEKEKQQAFEKKHQDDEL